MYFTRHGFEIEVHVSSQSLSVESNFEESIDVLSAGLYLHQISSRCGLVLDRLAFLRLTVTGTVHRSHTWAAYVVFVLSLHLYSVRVSGVKSEG